MLQKGLLSTSAFSWPRHVHLRTNLSLAGLFTLCVCVQILDKGVASNFCKGSHTQYLRHCWPYSFSSNYSILPRYTKVTIDNTSLHCVPIKLYSWTLKLEFHIIFKCHKSLFFFFPAPPPTVKNVKAYVLFMGIYHM